MRATIHTLLTSIPALTSVVPADRWYNAGAVIDRPDRMFVVLRWIAPVPSNARGRFLNQLRVDVHDRRGSYSRIDALLGNPFTGGGVYNALSTVLNLDGSDGRITQCDFLNHSGDQENEVYETNFKFSSWQVIGVNK